MVPSEELRPTCDEAAMARLSYLDWERSRAEELSEYVYRRRAVDLSFLAAEVVQSELTDSERGVIELIYYRQRRLSDAARELGRDKSTVKRTLVRAEEKIQRCLRYAVEYQYNLKTVPFMPVAVREALAVESWRQYSPKTLGERTKRLRMTENISAAALAKALGQSEAQINAIETGEPPDADTLVKLAAFFGTTADYLLTGKDAAYE